MLCLRSTQGSAPLVTAHMGDGGLMVVLPVTQPQSKGSAACYLPLSSVKNLLGISTPGWQNHQSPLEEGALGTAPCEGWPDPGVIHHVQTLAVTPDCWWQ